MTGLTEGYAVVDTETTGISVGYRHRIAEVAVVHVDPTGVVTDQWSTLINPERDLGPQAIHGIRACDAREAPRFAEAAGALVERVRGRVVVAHNWPFDAMHLRAEFARIGVDTPFGPDAGLCTMQAAGRVLPMARRSLIECCAAAGLADDRRWHTALDDARAAADLLGFLLGRAPRATAPTPAQRDAAAWRWPVLPPMTRPTVGRSAPDDSGRPHFLARLVDRVPRLGDPLPDAYLGMLDRALLDRQISVTEADALLDIAHDLGLHKAEVLDIHQRYLRQLAVAVWADGVVTADERHDMESVAAMLNLAPELVDQLLAAPPASVSSPSPFAVEGFRLAPGDRVVLTGTMQRGRAEIEAEATAAGLRMTASVSRGTKAVVAADPDSMSGKAKRARAAGVPVVSEECFFSALAAMRSRC